MNRPKRDDKISFPTNACEILQGELIARPARVRYQSHRDDVAVALELKVMPGRNRIRVPVALLRAFDERFAKAERSICVGWEGKRTELFMRTAGLTSWPSAARWRFANWEDGSNRCFETWLEFEPSAVGMSGPDYLLLRKPEPEGAEYSCAAGLTRAVWSSDVVRQLSARTKDQAALRRALYGGVSGNLVMYLNNGSERGDFLLPKEPFEAYLALTGVAPLELGLFDQSLGIDVTMPVETVDLGRTAKTGAGYIVRKTDQIPFGFCKLAPVR